jgi:hypothetical protein
MTTPITRLFHLQRSLDNVEEFDLRIPMTIWYEWGYLDYNVTIHVAGTAGRTE